MTGTMTPVAMKAPMIGSIDPAKTAVFFEFRRVPRGGRLFLSIGAYYTREFLADRQPFTAAPDEYNAYLARSGHFRRLVGP